MIKMIRCQAPCPFFCQFYVLSSTVTINLKTIKAEIFSKILEHLYHATVSQFLPQLMASRVFLLKPREIIITIYCLSDYPIK